VTQKRGFGQRNVVLRSKRAYRQSKSDDAWYLLTNLTDATQMLKAYSHRFSIEPLFKDYKSGGYHLEDCHADLDRFTALLVLIAIAYSIATLHGKRIRKKTSATLYCSRHRTKMYHKPTQQFLDWLVWQVVD